MADIITGGEPYAGLEIAVLATSGESPSYPSRWRRVPLAGDTMRFERIALTESPEFNPSGLAGGDKTGYGIFRGTFRTLVYYNADWFHWLMSAAHGGLEVLTTNELVTGAAAPTGGGASVANVHSYFLQSFRNTAAGSVGAVPVGIALRLHKADTGGDIEEINPAHIVSVRLEQAAQGWLTAEWEVVGTTPGLIVSPGILPVASGDYAIRPGDLSRDPTHTVLPSLCAVFAGAQPLSVDSWTVQIVNSIARAAPPTSVISQVMRAGHIARARYTGSVSVRFNTETHNQAPQSVLVAGNGIGNIGQVQGIRMRYISLADADVETSEVKNADNPNGVPYAFDIWLQNAMAKPGDTSLRDKGENVVTWEIVTVEKGLTGASTALPANYGQATGAVLQFQVSANDEPTPDTKFDTWSGNNPHASLT